MLRNIAHIRCTCVRLDFVPCTEVQVCSVCESTRVVVGAYISASSRRQTVPQTRTLQQHVDLAAAVGRQLAEQVVGDALGLLRALPQHVLQEQQVVFADQGAPVRVRGHLREATWVLGCNESRDETTVAGSHDLRSCSQMS